MDDYSFFTIIGKNKESKLDIERGTTYNNIVKLTFQSIYLFLSLKVK